MRPTELIFSFIPTDMVGGLEGKQEKSSVHLNIYLADYAPQRLIFQFIRRVVGSDADDTVISHPQHLATQC